MSKKLFKKMSICIQCDTLAIKPGSSFINFIKRVVIRDILCSITD